MNILSFFRVFTLLLFFNNCVEAKVLIITHSYNRPDFIEIQHKTFHKFFKDEYEFVVFNDAPKKPMCCQIAETCSKLGITCIKIPQTIHSAPYLPREIGEDYQNPAVRCANVVQYSLDILGFEHDGSVMIIDSDMFLIKDFSLIDYLGTHVLAGVPQKREHINYIWNGLLMLNMQTLPDKHTLNFNCKKIDDIPLDVGGHVYYYLQNHPTLNLAYIDNDYINGWDVLSTQQSNNREAQLLFDLKPNNIEFLLNYTFLHYRSGTNWDYRTDNYHKSKTEILNEFVDIILN
jgi:hypothetical protein